MCDYDWSDPTTAQEQIGFVRDALSAFTVPPHELLISPSGNMLDKAEVPLTARRHIFELAANQRCRLFLFETRPETVTATALEDYSRYFATKETRLGVEMGLESSQPWVLKYCVNKRMNLLDFQAAIALLHEQRLQSYANVSLGTAFLSEWEAIEDAVTTIRWAFAEGVDKVVLFPLHVKPYTVLHELWRIGMHSPTSLWSLTEVLLRLGEKLAASIEIAWYKIAQAGLPSYPVPYTCGQCADRVIALLDLYKRTMDFEVIVRIDRIVCPCHEAWRQRLQIAPRATLPERVATAYRVLAVQALGQRWWDRTGARLFSQDLADMYAQAPFWPKGSRS